MPKIYSAPVCVVGAGTMGEGIAQVALAAGHQVTLVDLDPQQLEKARISIRSRLQKRHPEVASALDEQLRTVSRIDEAPPLPNTIVIEAVVEQLDVKYAVLQSALDHFGASVILATNTSSLSITEVAAGVSKPERVVGMHFFNPVPVMGLVEVIPGVQTDPVLVAHLCELASSWGKTPTVAKSTPGFIVNRIIRPFYSEGLRLSEESVADIPVIDHLLRAGVGFPMGPFELMDLVGNDVNEIVTRTVWTSFGFDPRYSPSLLQRELVASGQYGRKVKRGYYDYRDNEAAPRTPIPPSRTNERIPGRTVLRGHSPDLEELAKHAGIDHDSSFDTPAHISVPGVGRILVTRGRTAAEEAELAGEPVALIDRPRDIKSTTALGYAVSAPSNDIGKVATALLAAGNIDAYALDDAPGLVAARVGSMIINEAVDAFHHKVATASDIDTAMQLGTGWPMGPLTWADHWTPDYVLSVLDAISKETRDPRYRASRELRSRVRQGLPFRGAESHPEVSSEQT